MSRLLGKIPHMGNNLLCSCAPVTYVHRVGNAK